MKKSSILGVIVIAVAIAVIMSTYANSSTYGSFKNAMQTNSQLHIIGHLDKGKQLFYDPTYDANYFAFYMTDNKGKEMKVVYTGTKPQDFELSEQIVLTGKMEGKEFHASKILMKCPSKYLQDKIVVTGAGVKAPAI